LNWLKVSGEVDVDRHYNPLFDPQLAAQEPRITFSAREVRHLTGAVLILTLAFAFLLEKEGSTTFVWPSPLLLFASFLAVGSGFVLHELAHKIVAQRYGLWAEFRAQFAGLAMSLIIVILIPFLFAAPGAVMILGRVTRRENALISLVGPGVNFVIALAALPFTFATDVDATLPFIMRTISQVNALLAVFNLIPAGPLDGKKVWQWSRIIWLVAFAASIGLFIIVMFPVLAR
jgi:Zn-dependent protease